MKAEAPYTPEDAAVRLWPQLHRVCEALKALPDAACPGDRAIVILTMHPAETASGRRPLSLLKRLGLEVVGSRHATVVPERSFNRRIPEEATTIELLVVGSREDYGYWDLTMAPTPFKSIRRIESIRLPGLEDRWRDRSVDGSRLDVNGRLVVDATLTSARLNPADVVGCLDEYVRTLDGEVERRYERFTGMRIDVPLRVAVARLPELAQFSMLVSARPMARVALRDNA